MKARQLNRRGPQRPVKLNFMVFISVCVTAGVFIPPMDWLTLNRQCTVLARNVWK